jgi:hypothetical protein
MGRHSAMDNGRPAHKRALARSTNYAMPLDVIRKS